MRSFIVNSTADGEHVVKACSLEYPALPKADLYKALKRRDIRIDGKRVSSDVKVLEGQEVQVWLRDELFEREEEEKPKRDRGRDFAVVAQTDGLLIVNKRQGLAVHSGKTTESTLIDIVRKETGNGNCELVHRIDMNTGGILMIAKDKEYLEDAMKLMKDGLVVKRYRALVAGRIPGDLGEPVICGDETIMSEVRAFLEKTHDGRIYIHDEKREGDLPVVTRYRVLGRYDGFSEIECELVTGRTHQIRAQFAHLGFPVLGDGNYGRNRINMNFRGKDGSKLKFQQLWSTGLLFGKIPPDNRHHDLSGRKFSINPRYEVML